jgi:hypothetical protein
MKAWRLLPSLALLGWPAGAEARRLPTRAQVERAVDAFFACRVECGGLRPFHRRLTSARCSPDDGQRGRVMCAYSGYNIGGDNIRGARRPPQRFRHDCAYLMPARRGWVMIGAAEFCED